jgi:hypothetical protein
MRESLRVDEKYLMLEVNIFDSSRMLVLYSVAYSFLGSAHNAVFDRVYSRQRACH